MFETTIALLIFALLGIPYLLLLRKAGLSPYWSLIFLVTPFGIPVGAWLGFPILALRAWPSRNEIPNKYFLAIPQNIALIAMHIAMPIFSFYVIFKKSGYSGWWCLIALCPPFAILMLWVCAFTKNEPQENVNA